MLYRHPPRDGVVVCMDEMGPLQTIPRGGRCWCRRPALRPDRYRRNGTVQLLAAFAPHLGRGVGETVRRKTGDAILAFLQRQMLEAFPGQTIHLIGDNLSAHKKALGLWEPKPARVRFYWTPTNASWLNLIEPWFAVLERTALHNTNLKTTDEISAHLLDGIEYLNAPSRITGKSNIAILMGHATRQDYPNLLERR